MLLFKYIVIFETQKKLEFIWGGVLSNNWKF